MEQQSGQVPHPPSDMAHVDSYTSLDSATVSVLWSGIGTHLLDALQLRRREAITGQPGKFRHK